MDDISSKFLFLKQKVHNHSSHHHNKHLQYLRTNLSWPEKRKSSKVPIESLFQLISPAKIIYTNVMTENMWCMDDLSSKFLSSFFNKNMPNYIKETTHPLHINSIKIEDKLPCYTKARLMILCEQKITHGNRH
jgi:hypothetical protein